MTADPTVASRLRGHPVVGLVFRLVLAAMPAYPRIAKLLEPQHVPHRLGDVDGNRRGLRFGGRAVPAERARDLVEAVDLREQAGRVLVEPHRAG